MKTPRHLSHLYQPGGRNSAPVVNLPAILDGYGTPGASALRTTTLLLVVEHFIDKPGPPPFRLHTQPLRTVPMSKPHGIITR